MKNITPTEKIPMSRLKKWFMYTGLEVVLLLLVIIMVSSYSVLSVVLIITSWIIFSAMLSFYVTKKSLFTVINLTAFIVLVVFL